jgi:hypothetical protein
MVALLDMTANVYFTIHLAPPNAGVESSDITLRHPWLQEFMTGCDPSHC